MFSIETARKFLTAADVFCSASEDDDKLDVAVNLSDVWALSCADCEPVQDDQLPRLAELFWRYGNCGLLYWVSGQRGGEMSQRCDVNRWIEFVRNEEKMRAEEPSSAKRSRLKREYVIGGDSGEKQEDEGENDRLAHTPGPWVSGGPIGCDVRQPRGRMIAYTGPHHTPVDEYPKQCLKEDQANAVLIAAAPALAEALRELHDFAEQSGNHRHKERSKLAFERAAGLLRKLSE